MIVSVTGSCSHFMQVLHAFASEGAHSLKVRDILNASDVRILPLGLVLCINKNIQSFSISTRLLSPLCVSK
jgi:hypothetical protein